MLAALHAPDCTCQGRIQDIDKGVSLGGNVGPADDLFVYSKDRQTTVLTSSQFEKIAAQVYQGMTMIMIS